MPTLSRRVTDEAGALSPADVERIEQKLAAYEQQTGHQLAVLIVKSLEGEVLEQYSIKVAEQWRLGDKKRDDGLLMFVSMDDHAIRIEVGYGLEGAIPDVVAARVIRDIMIPRFQQNDVVGAVDAGLDALMKAAQGESIGAPQVPPAMRQRAPWGTYALPLFFLMFVLLSVPRLVRAPLFAVGGFIIGYVILHSLIVAVVAGVIGLLIGAVAPVTRGGRGGGFGGMWLGGLGGFGGGGASGRW